MIENKSVKKKEASVEYVQGQFLLHMQELRAWVYSVVRNREIGDDLVQDIFLVVYKKAEDFEVGTNFRAWLFAIARYKTMEASRRPELREVCFESDILELLLPKPEKFRDNSCRLKILEKCISKLSPSARKAITLRYVDAKKPPSISKIMHWSVNSINVTLSRARISLKKCIEITELREDKLKGPIDS